MSDVTEPDSETIRLYVQGKLQGDALDEFELYYFEHPEILDEIAVEQSLASGLKRELPAAVATGSTPHLGGWFAWLSSPWWSGSATAAAVFFGMMLLLTDADRNGAELSTVIAGSRALEPVRGGVENGALPIIKVPNRQGFVALSLVWEGESVPEVVLKPQGGGVELKISEPSLNDLDILNVLVPAHALDSGTYSVSLVATGKIAATYDFKVQRE